MMEKVREAISKCECASCRYEKCEPHHEPCCDCWDDNNLFTLNDELEANLKAAKEALEKQTAKKVIWNNGEAHCVCGKGVPNYAPKVYFCNCCGQKLDWSV